MRCPSCLWKYPSSLLSPLVTSQGQTESICAICALEIISKIHGIKRTSFSGTMAEANRQAAIKWRETHPQDAPVQN